MVKSADSSLGAISLGPPGSRQIVSALGRLKRTRVSPDHRLGQRMISFPHRRHRAMCVRDGGESQTAAREGDPK